MTLTTGGKDWIAQNLGISNCMTETSRAFTYHDDQNNIDISATGGTATMMNRLIDSLVSYITIDGTKYYASALETANGSMPVYPADVQWVMANDSGADQYCVGVSPACTPGARRCRDSNTVEQCRADGSGWDAVQTCGTGYTCVNGSCVASAPPTTDTTVGPFEFEFGEVCTGDPTATIDVSGLKMWQETDTFRMNNFMVTNTSNCIAYFATQLKFWALGIADPVPATCPTTSPEWSGVDRSTWTPGDAYIEIATIAPGETKEIWLDFFVPTTTRGRKVLCMYLWANFSKYALYDELEAIGET